MKIKSLLFAGLLSICFLSPGKAFADDNNYYCACCSEPGEYSIWTGTPDTYKVDLLKEMKFDKAAFLYMNEAGLDAIKGLDSLAKTFESDSWIASSGELDLSNVFAAKTWKFNFKTKDGKTGTLALPAPASILVFKADIHDGKKSGGNGPLLYKEWRFKGNVQTGNGFFQAGIVNPTTYFLVLQGRGNSCDNPEDFTNWQLEISGRKAAYRFFGKMRSANKDYIFDESGAEN